MVLPELTGRVAERLEQLCDRGILRLKSKVGSRNTDLREARAYGVLAGDEGGSARRARLLGVVVGEFDALARNPVDVGCLVAHRAPVVVADVVPADVVAPKNEDIWSVRHDGSPCS